MTGRRKTSRASDIAGAFQKGGSRFILAILLVFLATSFACGSGDDSEPTPGFTTVHVGDATFQAELSMTRSERALGLGNRDSLPADNAMLFVYPGPRETTLFMKDMRFPLDFIWISAEERVVKLDENVLPPADGQTELPTYPSGQDVQYMLEINAGLVQELGITVGDAVTFDPEVDTTSAE